MKFVSNTHPIVEGLDLGIIQANISKFYQKSCIVELTVDEGILRVNSEAASIKSELRFSGNASGDGYAHVFVDSLLFKNLMKTIDTDTVEFEFGENDLTIHSGKSKFTLPQVVSGEDLELSRPALDVSQMLSVSANKSGWEFIKDKQMYAIAMSFIHPVYTNVWLGESGDVIVGDVDNSIFTHSTQVSLPSTCLITDTVVNLLAAIPEDAKIIQLDRSYEIRVDTDPYTYICEFTPKYESDAGVGDYNSSIILSLFNKPEHSIQFDISKISKYISQAELFTVTNDDTINLKVSESELSLVNQNVTCAIAVDNPFEPFEITFKITLLKDLISHMDVDEVSLCPLTQDGEVVGIVLWTDAVEAVLAGVE